MTFIRKDSLWIKLKIRALRIPYAQKAGKNHVFAFVRFEAIATDAISVQCGRLNFSPIVKHTKLEQLLKRPPSAR
jgi:hypothetical protein